MQRGANPGNSSSWSQSQSGGSNVPGSFASVNNSAVEGEGSWSKLVLLVSLLFLFVVFLPLVIEGIDSGRLLYNSDIVHLYLLIGDALRDPSALLAWNYSAALYTFPDWLLGAPLVALPIPNAWLPLVYSAVVMTLYCFAGGALLASTREIKLTAGAWLFATFLICGGLAALMFPQAASSAFYMQLLLPYIHTGAVLSTLIAATLLLHLLFQSGQSSKSLAALGFVTFASSFSDQLFFVWFVMPACFTTLLHAWATGRRRGVLLSTVVLVSAAFGWIVERAVHLVSFDYGTSWSSSPDLLGKLLNATLRDPPLLLIGVALLAVLIRGAILVFRFVRQDSPTAGQTLELLLATIGAAALTAPVAANMLTDFGKLRYLLIVVLVPALWLGYHLLRAIASRPRLSRLVQPLPTALLLACALLVLPGWSAAKRLVAPGPMELCLDAEGRKDGLGDYWSAKSIIFSSNRRIHVAQLTSDGTTFYGANFNNHWFTNRADDSGTLHPNFILPANLDAERLRRRFGVPDRVRNCGGQDVWLYNESLLSFPKHLEKRGFTSSDRSRVGRLKDQQLISTGKKGLLYASDYAMFDAGNYELTIYGSSDAAKSARVDVVSEKGRTRHAKFELYQSDDKGVLFKGPVSIERAVSDLEVRVHVGKNDRVRLTGFDLVRGVKINESQSGADSN